MNSYNKNDIAILANETHFLRDNLEKVLQASRSALKGDIESHNYLCY